MSAQDNFTLLEKPVRFGADPVHVNDEGITTEVRTHGAHPQGVQHGSVTHSVSEHRQPQHTL